MKKLTIILLLLITTCMQSAEAPKQEKTSKSARKTLNHFNQICSLKLPDKLDFCGESIPLNIPEVRERAEREFYLLLQQPGQIILYLKRSGRYFPMFERIIKKNNMPDDLKYLAVAESALYMSRSSKGALGLWQFIESTGKKMGLQIDKYVDERRHPEKSTQAAMKYLKQGYKVHKSWILTAAGYNMGHTKVHATLNYQSGEDYFDLFLSDETSRFIFRIAIIKEIMQNADKYGFVFSEDDLWQPRKTKSITWKKSIPDIAEWARNHGTTYKYVKLLNPWILKRMLQKPRGGRAYKIYIPAD